MNLVGKKKNNNVLGESFYTRAAQQLLGACWDLTAGGVSPRPENENTDAKTGACMLACDTASACL